MKKKPLVSIIGISFNHDSYIVEALNSIYHQTYEPIELIIIDDASSDNSFQSIKNWEKSIDASRFFSLLVLKNKENKGNCASFNRAYAHANGHYIIDFALDDVLLDERVAQQVAFFEELDGVYGVIYSNCAFIDDRSTVNGYQYPVNHQSKVLKRPPEGDVYMDVLKKYCISSPTMMTRKAVLDDLNGYDEQLSYEDFDFWVRSSRKYRYAFQDQVLTFKRIHAHNLSSQFYKKRENHLMTSTLKVCYKAYELNKDQKEHEALAKRIRYFIRLSFYTENWELLKQFYVLLNQIQRPPNYIRLIRKSCCIRLPVFPLYRSFLWLRKKYHNLKNK